MTPRPYPSQTEAMRDLQELIRDARTELKIASGLPLNPEEQDEERHKAAVNELRAFLLRRLKVTVQDKLCMQVIWISEGPVAILKCEDQVFHLRQAGDGNCLLFLIEGQAEREIAPIKDSDPHFTSRVLVAIGDAGPARIEESIKLEADNG